MAALLSAGPAFGQEVVPDRARVALVRPTGAKADIVEAFERIQGELTADGFDVAVVDSAADSDPAAFADAISDPDAIAFVGLSIAEGGNVAELRVLDRATNKVVIRRTPLERQGSRQQAQVLAVRAVELLRASLLELLITARPPTIHSAAPSLAPLVPRATERAATWAAKALVPQQPPTWGAEAGAAMALSLGGLDPAVLALVRVRAALKGPLALRLTVAGLGSEAHVYDRYGSADVSQTLGLVELVAIPVAESIVHPIFSLGVGALNVEVTGHAADLYVPLRTSLWSVAADAGIGLGVRLGRQFDLALEAHALLAFPYPVVEFLGDQPAKTGWPMIMVSSSIVGWP